MNVPPAIVEQLAFFVFNLSVKTIPQSVIEEAKRCIVDTIGVIVAGQSALGDKSDQITRNFFIASTTVD